MSSLYCTLDEAKAELLAENTVDDAHIMRLIREFSSRIDTKFKSLGVALFVPFIEARNIALYGGNINSGLRTLELRTYTGGVSPLLSLTGVSLSNQTLTVGTNVQTWPAAPAPWYAIQLMGDCWYSWYTDYCSNTWGPRNVTVTGIWGYNADYAHAWIDATTLVANINSTVTSFTVTALEGSNAYGESPLISAGNVIRIGTEWMDVISTASVTVMAITTNTITVVRGVNGSTAAAHTAADAIQTYRVDESIKRAVVRQVCYMYARQGAFDTYRIDGLGATMYPPDLVQEVSALLSMFANM